MFVLVMIHTKGGHYMRINAITNVNYQKSSLKKQVLSKKDDAPVTNEVSFKGAKGASVGAAAGLGYLALVSVIAGPLMPITLGMAALVATSGAVAGHNIEKDFKSDKNKDKK